MVSISLAIGFAVIVACLVLISRKVDRAQLTGLRASSPLLKVQIVCGDCAGEEGRPRRTFADRRGRCEECGGDSYVLASISFARAQRRASGGLPGQSAVIGRVAKFERPPARTKKIAV
ncbi:MAG: hypothetical protein L0229_02340 [Blastocatellia bacterium]|nr:hypothetical protein [Blastocatellia bacterium]